MTDEPKHPARFLIGKISMEPDSANTLPDRLTFNVIAPMQFYPGQYEAKVAKVADWMNAQAKRGASAETITELYQAGNKLAERSPLGILEALDRVAAEHWQARTILVDFRSSQ